MNPKIIFMLGAFALVLIGISYFTARVYATSFRFNGQQTKITFLIFLLIPLFFVASMILSRSASWGIGSFGYTILQTIAGFGLYLFFGALLLALLMLIAILLQTTLPTIVPISVVIASLLLGVLGMVQAKTITVTPYTVTLPNAPESWNGKTAVLVTDTHFGLVNHAKFSDKVIKKIISLNPDIVLHAGDFYDGPKVDTALISASWKKLTDTVPVFYAPGNHEGYGTYKEFMESAQNANITILEDKVVTYEGVQIAGITYRDGKDNVDAAEAIKSLMVDNTKASIIINHPPTSLFAAAQQGISLMVSGHTHNGQLWPLNYISKAVYGAYTYGLNTYKDMQVLTSRGVGTFGPPLRTFNQAELVLITFKTR